MISNIEPACSIDLLLVGFTYCHRWQKGCLHKTKDFCIYLSIYYIRNKEVENNAGVEEKKIRKVGNSVVITIPQDFLERANIHVGEMVDVKNDAWDC